MTTSRRHPVEVRVQAVRMAFDGEDEHDSQGAAIGSIASGSRMTSETLREWLRQADPDGGRHPGLTTDVVLAVAHAS